MILTWSFYIFSPVTYEIICENITCKINRIKNSQLKLSRLMEGKLLANFAANFGIRSKMSIGLLKIGNLQQNSQILSTNKIRRKFLQLIYSFLVVEDTHYNEFSYLQNQCCLWKQATLGLSPSKMHGSLYINM